MPEKSHFLTKICLLFALIILSKSCNPEFETEDAHDSRVLMISIDGFRYDYLEYGSTPVLDSLITSGVMAESLIPVFPSKTFPNHITQVTGLYPENHGIVSNRMYDAQFDEYYSIGAASESVRDGKWYDGEPIWVTARKQGLASAVMYWPGSEAEILGMRPDFYFAYDGQIKVSARIEQVLEWIASPSNAPELILMYLGDIDRVGHRFGPNSSEMSSALVTLNSQLSQLFSEIQNLGYSDKLNLVVVSDHGMEEISRDKVIFLDDYIAMDQVEVINWSPILELIPLHGNLDSTYAVMKNIPHMQVFKKRETPDSWHFKNNSRITPLVAVADLGWSITSHDYFLKHPAAFTGGTHGYPVKAKSMHGIFIASGPSFASNKETSSVKAVDIYELLCYLLQIQPSENQGSLDSWMPLLN